MSRALEYRSIKFEKPLAKYREFKTFAPIFPPELEGEWYYLGPVAFAPESSENNAEQGLIVKANDPAALDEIDDWEPVFIDIEGAAFSTWRGIPRNKDDYVVNGHFFVEGIEKPSPKQTAGIKAIHKSLISEREPNHFVWKVVIPFAILTIWDVLFTDRLHILTGTFISSSAESSGGTLIGVLRFDATIQW